MAGLAGMVVVNGAEHLLAQNFSPGYGYQGIAVAALGAFHPLGALIASIFYSALSIGGESLQRSAAAIPIELIYALQAIIVLSVLIVQRWIGDGTKEEMNEMVVFGDLIVYQFLASSLTLTMPILFASTGEVYAESQACSTWA